MWVGCNGWGGVWGGEDDGYTEGGRLLPVVRENVFESPESSESLMRCVKLCGGQSNSDLLEPCADTRDAALLARRIAHVFYNF